MTPILTSLAGTAQCGAWTRRWVQPYESTFSWLQKYAWVNLADAHEILRDLFGRHSPNAPHARADLACGMWIDEKKVSPPPGLPLREGLLSLYGRHWPPRLARHAGPLRFCESCLRDGYHSMLFQIEGLARCPLHDVALLSQCPHCGSPTVPFGLQTESFATPFHCFQCRGALAKPFDPRRWSLPSSTAHETERALGGLDVWLRKLSQYVSLCSDEAPLAQLKFQGVWTESSEVVWFDIARHVVPFPLPARFAVDSRRPLTYRFSRTRRVSQSKAKACAWQLAPNVRHSIYRSIRQHLLRTWLKSHRGCVRQARANVLSRTIMSRREILHHPMGCPMAKAFVRWDLQYEEYVQDLRAERLGVSMFSRWRAEDADNVLWAWETLAEFVCSAATELELELDSQEAQAPEDVMAVSRELAPYLNLTHRDIEATWDVEIDRDAGRHLIIAGDLSILRELEVHGREKCEAGKRSRRAHRARRNALGAGIRGPPAVGETIRNEKWSDDWVSPFESALFVLLKYIQENPQCASVWELLLFHPTRPSSHSRLLWGHAMHQPRPLIAAGEALRAGTLGKFAPRWRCGLLTSTHIRFCPQCLKVGYHSVFYQIQALTRCPLHGATVQDECAHCGALTPAYEPTRIRKDLAYVCHECKTALFMSKELGPADGRMRKQLLERLQPLAQWLAECERAIPFHRPAIESPLAELRLDGPRGRM